MSSLLDWDEEEVVKDAAATVVPPPDETVMKQLQLAVSSSGLPPASGLQIRQQFDSFFSQVIALQMVSANIKDPKAAGDARKSVKAVRVAAEKKRVELKEDSLRKGKTIDAIFNVIKNIAEPIEAKLFEIESAEARKAAKARAERADSFKRELEKYEVNTEFIVLADMSDADFQKLLIDSKYAFEGRVAARKAEEEKQKAAAELKAKELERLQAENDELRIKQQLDAAAAQEKIRQAEVERNKALAQQKIDADLLAGRLAKEREEKAARDREAQRIAAAPDIEKLTALRDAFNAVPFPRLTSAKGEWAEEEIRGAFMSFIGAIEDQIKTLS